MLLREWRKYRYDAVPLDESNTLNLKCLEYESMKGGLPNFRCTDVWPCSEMMQSMATTAPNLYIMVGDVFLLEFSPRKTLKHCSSLPRVVSSDRVIGAYFWTSTYFDAEIGWVDLCVNVVFGWRVWMGAVISRNIKVSSVKTSCKQVMGE